ARLAAFGSSLREERVIPWIAAARSGQTPTPVAARIAEPATAVSRTAGTSTVNPVTSALIWFHVSLRAGPPQTRIDPTSTPAATIDSATWRIANADASRIARVRWPRPWPRARPANAPRAVGSQSGDRSPAR